MTSLTLLLWIALSIGLQIAVYLGIGFWRHWRGYQDLRSRVADLPEPPAAPTAAEAAGVPAWTGYRNFRVARKVIEDAALSVCSFYLVPEDGQPLPPFLSGQFLTFRLDLPTAAGGTEALVRCYSLSDGPRTDYYRVSVKRVPAPPGSGLAAGRSSNFFHDRVTVGSVLPVRAPAGHFHIDRSDAPAVLIGGGIGITPLLSMLDACLAAQPQREFWLFYGVRHGGELVMAEHLAALAAAHANFHLRLCFSAPRPSDVDGSEERRRGRIDVRLLRQELPLKPYHFYLCGPGPMMESLVPALEDWGVPAAHIHYEAFGPASIKRRPAAVPAAAPADTDIVVGFARSGKELAWQASAGSLLEFAEASGIAVNSGCRAGGCGSCQTTIKSGEVAYRQPPDFDPEPGTCLLCVCTPKTSITLEA